MKMTSVLPVLVAGAGLVVVSPGKAQEFKTLYSFSALSRDYGSVPRTNSDGAFPAGRLILSGDTLYGTVREGGANGRGAIFAIKTDGTEFRILHSFTAEPQYGWPYGWHTNSDGIWPNSLIASGTTLYGTAESGGAGDGTIYSLQTDGTGFTILRTFAQGDGSPVGPLVLSGNVLYGTTSGYLFTTNNSGAVFAVLNDGTGFTNLYSFPPIRTYNDFDSGTPAIPRASLTLAGGTLYGVTQWGGFYNGGTAFRVNTNGTGFGVVSCFWPEGELSALLFSHQTLYGTMSGDGSVGTGGNGLVYARGADSLTMLFLHYFTETPPPSGAINSDGAGPLGGLILSGNTLYGTASAGGASGKGTVFSVNTDGSDFSTLYSFSSAESNGDVYTNSDGVGPSDGVILSGNALYGTTRNGGSGGTGTIFRLPLLPYLTIIAREGNVSLSWPTNGGVFTLQATTDLGSAVGWTAVSPGPIVINGRNAVTMPLSPRQFFRLTQ